MCFTPFHSKRRPLMGLLSSALRQSNNSSKSFSKGGKFMAGAIQDTKVFRMSAVSRGVLAACGAGTMAVAAPAAFGQGTALEEIVVTATKREEGVQNIPISVMVMGDQQLQDLNIADLEDYIQMLPNVSYISLGPGSGSVYVRGISSGGESGIGANPSDAIYLDDQPVTSSNSNMNPHIYAIQQIEVLAVKTAEKLIQSQIKRMVINLRLIMNTLCHQKIYAQLDFWIKF